MQSCFRVLAGAVVLSAIPLPAVRAAVPRTIAFQGVLTNAARIPLPDGTYPNVAFRLYDHLTGPAQLWIETKSVVVAGGHGVFATALGSATAIPASVTFDQPYWLSVQVGSDPEMTPRLPLQSVPYALNAWSIGGNAGTSPTTCFLGTTDNQPLVLKGNGHRVLQLQDVVNAAAVRSVNVLLGSEANSIAAGVIGGTIGGGGRAAGINDLHGDFGTIGGGAGNFVDAYPYAVIAGGSGNITQGAYAVIGGGSGNNTQADYTTVGGGTQNYVSGVNGFVGGGTGNQSTGLASGVSNGSGNSAAGQYASVGGGHVNTARGILDYVGGGEANVASGGFSVVGAGAGNAVHSGGGTIGGGVNNVIGATVATGSRETIGGGEANAIYGSYGAIGGGHLNQIGTITSPRILPDGATVAGGVQNQVLGSYGTIGGGQQNTVSGIGATIGGGQQNLALGVGATVPGGFASHANADYSFAAGYRAIADARGSFVWADASVDTGLFADADNEFCIRSAGGMLLEMGGNAYIYTGTGSVELNRYLELLNSHGRVSASGLKAGGILCADDFGYANPGKNNMTVKGTLGVGYPDPAPYTLAVNGDIYSAGSYRGSDARYKRNVQTLDEALSTVASLRGVSFDWDRQAWKDRNFPAGRQIGFIAQEVEKVLPEVVSTDDKGYKAVSYESLVPVLVEAVKEQQKEIADLRARAARVDDLEARLKRLESVSRAAPNGR